MRIITESLTLDDLKAIAAAGFGDMIKAVADTEKEWLALDGELHADLEALLLEKGSKQKNLWGITLYPDIPGDDFVEFDSMINVRPSQHNRTRGVEDAGIREQILRIITKKIRR